MIIKLKKEVFLGYMDNNNFTVYSLAAAMNVAPSSLYRIIKGERRVGATLIDKLLRVFDLTEEDFATFFVIQED